MIKKLITIVSSIILFSACVDSKPSENLTDKIAKDLTNKGSDIYTVKYLQRVNGWNPEEGKNIYTVKYKYQKELNQSYSLTILRKSKEIYKNLDPEDKIIYMTNDIQLMSLRKMESFEEESVRSNTYSKANAEKLPAFMKKCSECREYLSEFPKESIITTVRGASMSHALLFLEEKYGIPIIDALSSIVPSEIEFSLRKTDAGWDLIK